MNSITESAGKVKTLDEVKVGSEEQTRGIEQVAKAITQMEKVTQTTAANAEQSASAAGRRPGRGASGQGSQKAMPPKHSAGHYAVMEPAMAAVPAGNEFPLEDDFKEF